MTLIKPGTLLRPITCFQGLTIAQGCMIALSVVVLALPGCGSADDQGTPTPTNSQPAGSTVSLIWDPVTDSNVVGYYIHYGKQSPNQSGSCDYGQAAFVPSPEGTVTGLDSGSTYYFAVSAYNGARGDCSNEVQAQT